MGARLTKAAFREAAALDPPLTDRAMLVLVYMATKALDTPSRDNPAQVYWRGWEAIAREALGYRTYDQNTPAHQAVARAVRELNRRGLIKVADRGYGYRTAYVVLPGSL